MKMTAIVCSVMAAVAWLVIQPRLSPDRKHPPADGGAVTEKREPVGKGDESLWAAVSAARHAVEKVGEREGEMEWNKGARYFAANPGQDLTARFLDEGVRLGSGRSGGWSATMRFRGTPGTLPETAGDRVDYHHEEGLTEWYVNRPQGIEHGFTVHRRPREAEGELRLAMALEGLAVLDVGDEGQGLEFVDEASGRAVVRYDGLKAWDATGRTLAARMESEPEGWALVVEEQGAVYPLTIDPLITSLEQKLRPVITGDGAGGDHFGTSVGLSGNMAVVGAPHDDAPAGANAGGAYVFVRNGSSWSLQQKLVPGETGAGDEFGHSVAIAGETVVVGARLDDTAAGMDAGSAWVFTRNGTVWTQQARLVAGNGAAEDWFGYSVAVEGDTAIVGATRQDGVEQDVGAAYIFVRSGTAWSQQARLTASDGSYVDNFGTSVALSGGTALVGAEGDDYYVSFIGSTVYNVGSAYVFTRSGTTWSQQAKLLPDETYLSENSNFARSVALSGNTALVGHRGESGGGPSGAGVAYVFTRSGTVWTKQAKLSAADRGTEDYFGTSVALSADTALIGSVRDDTVAGTNAGSAYVFTRSGTAWSQQAKLEAVEAMAGDLSGTAVALSGDTAIIGAPNAGGAFAGDDWETSDAGSAFVFTRSGTAWTQQTELNSGMGAAGHYFGDAVDIDGDRAVVGAPGEDTTSGFGDGGVYVFTRSGTSWTLEAKFILAPKGYFDELGDGFGSSVAISGNTILVGAPMTFNSTGAAYVYAYSGGSWSLQASLGPGISDLTGFGGSVALEGDTALIGAPYQQQGRGRVYAYRRTGSTWPAPFVMAASDAAPYDAFGSSVALSGDTAVVGANDSDPSSFTSAGSAYVFTRSGSSWAQQAKLTASDKAIHDRFGTSVAVSGDTILVGAIQSGYFISGGTAGVKNGCAYIFTRSGVSWNQQAKLVASDGTVGDYFGNSVTLEAGAAVVGAPYKDTTAGANAGAAYVFTQGSGWAQQAILGTADAAVGDTFGRAVAVSGDTVILGAPGAGMVNPYTGETQTEAGAVYVYRLEAPTPRQLYDDTAASAGLAGNDALPSTTPFHDGVPNLIKYAFNLNLGAVDVRTLQPGTGIAGLPSIRGGNGIFRFEFIRRIGSGLTYTPVKSPDMSAASWTPLTSVPVIIPINAQWERVVYEEAYDPTVTPRCFGRLVVSLP
jgi:hypothetical protein